MADPSWTWWDDLKSYIRWDFIDRFKAFVRRSTIGKALVAYMTTIGATIYAYFSDHPRLLDAMLGALVFGAGVFLWSWLQWRFDRRGMRSEKPLQPDALEVIDLQIDLVWEKYLESCAHWPTE